VGVLFTTQAEAKIFLCKFGGMRAKLLIKFQQKEYFTSHPAVY